MTRTSLPSWSAKAAVALVGCVILVVSACSNSDLGATSAVQARGEAAETGTPVDAGVAAGEFVPGADQATDDSTGSSASNSAPSAAPRSAPAAGRRGQSGSSNRVPTPRGKASAGSTVGVTADSIRISVSAPFSGAYGVLYNKIFTNGVQTWQNEINANGGINGRRIELVKVDNQYSPEGAVAACKEIRGNSTFIVIVLASKTGQNSCLDEAGIPTFDVLPPTWNNSWRNVLGFAYYASFAPTEVSFFKSAYVNGGSKKFGIIYEQDLDQFVAEAEAVQAALTKANMPVVDVEKVTSTQAAFVSEMSRMKAAGVEVALAYVTLNMPNIIRDARAVGFEPVWYTSANLDLITESAGAVMNGVLSLRPGITAETPEYAAFVAKVQKYGGNSAASSADTFDAQYYASAAALGEMIRLAGADLGRTSFLSAARTISGFNASGLIGPFTLKGRSLPLGVRSLFPIVCCSPDYTWKSLGPPREQF